MNLRHVSALALTLTMSLAAAAATKPTNPPNPVVNINTASEAELEMLPGVGPKLATAIYTHAEAGEPGKGDPKCDHRCHFKTVNDLLKVKGIGPKNLAKMRPYVALTGPTTAKQKIKVAKAATTAAAVAPAPAGTRCGPGVRCAQKPVR